MAIKFAQPADDLSAKDLAAAKEAWEEAKGSFAKLAEILGHKEISLPEATYNILVESLKFVIMCELPNIIKIIQKEVEYGNASDEEIYKVEQDLIDGLFTVTYAAYKLGYNDKPSLTLVSPE